MATEMTMASKSICLQKYDDEAASLAFFSNLPPPAAHQTVGPRANMISFWVFGHFVFLPSPITVSNCNKHACAMGINLHPDVCYDPCFFDMIPIVNKFQGFFSNTGAAVYSSV